MLKGEIVEAMSELGYYKGQASEAINDVFRIIATALVRDRERVKIPGFGSFEVKKYKGHMAYDASSKEKRMLDDFYVVTFKPGDNLKDAIKTGDVSKLNILYGKKEK